MRPEKAGVLLLLAFVVSVLVASAAVAQEEAAAVEEALGLDRPTRRLIQQGLRNEGFDPGAPDGLFGPRTRAAIRRWQEARGVPPTGYLDSTAAAELLGSPRPPVPEAATLPALPVAEPQSDGTAPTSPLSAVEVSADPSSAAVNCEEWNTEAFFEMATASAVTACLGAGADVAARDDQGVTPLHWAAWSSTDPAVVETLLTIGADLEAGNGNDGTPLHNAAVNNGNPAVIETLLAAGADIEAQDDRGFTPLHLAAWRNANPAVLEALIAAGAELATPNDRGMAPAENAAWANGNPAVLGALLAAGVDPETETNDGRTLLHLVAQNNENPGVLEALLAAGADLEALDNRGNTPLSFAVSDNDNPAVVEVLLAAGADVSANALGSPLHSLFSRSLFSRNTERQPSVLLAIADALLAAGAEVNARTAIGSTALHFAMRDGGVIIDRLIAAGADVNVTNRLGETPLFSAPPGAAPEVRSLVTAGADATARNDRGGTPLHSARDADIVRVLLSAGADATARNDRGGTPLHSARDADVVRVLLSAGADVDARDAAGRTPLHSRIALRSDRALGVVDVLVAAGADANARARNGNTPLHNFFLDEYFLPEAAIVNALVMAGANLEARNEQGNTPLHLAAAWSHRETANLVAARWANVAARWAELHPNDEPHAGHIMDVLLEAGADPTARNTDGHTPWDLAQQNYALKESDAYWRLNDVRFNAPRQELRRDTVPPLLPPVVSRGFEQPGRQGPGCEIPGYPNPINVESLGLNWCGSTVGLQRRAIALQAAGAWCAIAEGTSSSPEQVSARHQDINAACDALDALGALGGPPCQCPTGYRP